MIHIHGFKIYSETFQACTRFGNRYTLLLILSVFFSFQAAAQTNLLDAPVTIKVVNEPINDVLLKIAELTNISFSFNSSLIPATEKISIDVNNMPVGDVFKILFKAYNIDVKAYDNNIIIYKRKGHKTIFKKDYVVVAPSEAKPQEEKVKEKPIVKPKEDVPEPLVKPEVVVEKMKPTVIDTIEKNPVKTDSIMSEVKVNTYLTSSVAAKDSVEVQEKVMNPIKEVEQEIVTPISAETPPSLQKPSSNNEYFSLGIRANYLLPFTSIDTIEIGRIKFNHQLAPTFNASFYLNYHVNKFILKTRLQALKFEATNTSSFYSTFTTKTEIVDTNTCFIQIIPSTGDTLLFCDTTITYQIDLDSTHQTNSASSTYRFIEIPLALTYQLIQEDKWSIGLNAEFITSIYLNSKGEFLNDEGIVEEIGGAKAQTFFSAGIELNYTYSFNKKWSFMLQGAYRKALGDTFYKENISNKKVDFVGVSGGIAYRF
ncbi:MAG: secretin and TonB N-terminal domain-containing protein [Flavobacteriales bacterium]|nr:secretin and TonB N-terminal domain-containing protein [Flavobacteriales bacterium]